MVKKFIFAFTLASCSGDQNEAESESEVEQGLCGISYDQCIQVAGAGSACNECVCQSCVCEAAACTTDKGCAAMLECARSVGCSGTNCYAPTTCQKVIDQYGGPFGYSTALAQDFANCLFAASCVCPDP